MDCRTCREAEKRGAEPSKHDCRKNWSKSSKAMEPDIAVSLAEGIQKHGVKLYAMIADDDAATIKRVREEVDAGIDKWADLSHTKKNFGSKLDSAKGTHSALKIAKVTAHITKCFMYSIKANKGDVDKVRSSLLNVTDHLFGCYDRCREWCKARKLPDPSTYKYSSLPRGKPLQSAELRKFLEDLFQKQAQNAEKLAPCGSSNRSEALNSTFTSLAPKRIHIGDSEAYDFRLGCGVASKNIGAEYVLDVNKTAGLSPGRHTKAHAQSLDSTKERHRSRKATRILQATTGAHGSHKGLKVLKSA